MATEIAKAYVHIMPSARGFSSNLRTEIGPGISAAGTESGQLLGANLIGKLKGMIAAAGLGAMVKEALFAGGDLQQSFGGLDTIYGQASDSMKDMAKQAQAAGVDMNNYAEQAVSFGASLKQAYGDDIKGAANAANQAILDMADNSAKMGTDISSIQNAYQGFAKGNYMMLDNLKLGYGGTKTEMERLLADAEKLHEQTTGEVTHYDINNLGDVYAAIHDVQENLGLTGVAAYEAATTFTGSMGAMKAAATNFFADLTTGGDVTSDLQTLMQSVNTFVVGNLFPMIKNIVTALPPLIFETLSTTVPQMIQSGISMMDGIASGLAQGIPKMLGNVLPMITQLTGELRANAGKLIDSGLNLILNLAQGIANSFPVLVENVPTIVSNIAGIINDNMPKILTTAVKIIVTLVKGLLQAIPVIIQNMPKIIMAIVDVITAFNWLNLGKQIITFIKNGIVAMKTAIPTSMKQIITNVKTAFTNFNWSELGRHIIDGIIVGLKNTAGALYDWMGSIATSCISTIKSKLGIHSPSRVFRDEVGKWIPAGIAVGVQQNAGLLTSEMDNLSDMALESFNVQGINDINVSQDDGAYAILLELKQLLESYLPLLAQTDIILDGDTLVGRLAQRIDEALGKLERKNQRGVSFA